MASPGKRDFDREAAAWDEDPGRVALARAVADAVTRAVTISPDHDAMDYGCGTGLVTLELQPRVRGILAVDSSRGMLDVLEEKTRRAGIAKVRTLLADLERDSPPDARFHLIVSSMTMHHVRDVGAMVRVLAGLLHPGGALCIADLDTEDGSFHADKAGVQHFGFDREEMKGFFEDAGLGGVTADTAAAFERPTEGGQPKGFSVFLVCGRRG